MVTHGTWDSMHDVAAFSTREIAEAYIDRERPFTEDEPDSFKIWEYDLRDALPEMVQVIHPSGWERRIAADHAAALHAEYAASPQMQALAQERQGDAWRLGLASAPIVAKSTDRVGGEQADERDGL